MACCSVVIVAVGGGHDDDDDEIIERVSEKDDWNNKTGLQKHTRHKNTIAV